MEIPNEAIDKLVGKAKGLIEKRFKDVFPRLMDSDPSLKIRKIDAELKEDMHVLVATKSMVIAQKFGKQVVKEYRLETPYDNISVFVKALRNPMGQDNRNMDFYVKHFYSGMTAETIILSHRIRGESMSISRTEKEWAKLYRRRMVNIEGIVRTAVYSTINQFLYQIYLNNDVKLVKWTDSAPDTPDSSDYCGANRTKKFQIGTSPIPAGHINCRDIILPAGE